MIKGSEEHTKELTLWEINRFVDEVIQLLKNEDKPITSFKIANELFKKGFKTQTGLKLSDSKIRKIIEHIRTNHLLKGLIADKRGYWIENNKDILIDYYTESSLKRGMAVINWGIEGIDDIINEVDKKNEKIIKYFDTILKKLNDIMRRKKILLSKVEKNQRLYNEIQEKMFT